MKSLAVLALALVCTAGCGRDEALERDPEELRYAALGDSFTSGAGIPTVDPSNGCQRSDHNYPALLAEAIGATLSDASCGSATTEAVADTQPGISPPPPPQLDAVTADTDLVTVGLGLNDLRFFYDIIISCPQLTLADPTGTPCTQADEASELGRLEDRLPLIRDRLTETLDRIAAAAPDATVVLVGYPQLVPARGSCAELPISPGDYTLVAEAFEGLAAAMNDAAERAGATFVDVLEASRGHDLCAGTEAWVNGPLDTPEALGYHPFLTMHREVAELVRATLAQ